MAVAAAAALSPFFFMDITCTPFLSALVDSSELSVALRGVQAREGGSKAPLAAALGSSGLVAGASAAGRLLSCVVVGLLFPDRLLISKLPAYLLAAGITCGCALFLVAEVALWPIWVLYVARTIAAAGMGNTVAVARRASLAPDTPHWFFTMELFSIVGLAAGPLISGCLEAIFGRENARFGPPASLGLFGLLFFFGCCALPMGGAAGSPTPDRLADAAADDGSGSDADESAPLLSPDVGSPSKPHDGARRTPPPTAPGDAQREGPPPVWVTAVVNASCLLFGASRNFIRSGLESAMVVVYEKEFGLSPTNAAIVASLCAFSPIVSAFGYKMVKERLGPRLSYLAVLHVAEGFGFVSALLMMSIGFVEEPGAGGGRAAAALAMASQVTMYPSLYLGAALSNARPLALAQPQGHWLSATSMIVQQKVLNAAPSVFLGMYAGRVLLGEPVRLARLGNVFFALMVSQTAVMALGWDPEATWATMRRCCFRLRTSCRVRPRPRK